MNVYEGDWQLAPSEGIFLPRRALGASVSRGEPVAEIHQWAGLSTGVVSLSAERDGIVLGLRSKALIREGNWAILIGNAGAAS